MWSSLFYNTTARHERCECNANGTTSTRVQHEQNECNTSETWATWVRYKCDTSATRVQYKCNKSATRVKNFDFDNSTSKNTFSQPILAIWQMENCKEKSNFILLTNFWKETCFHTKMRLKSAPLKLNFAMAKDISNSYTLDYSCKCPCTFSHSYT